MARSKLIQEQRNKHREAARHRPGSWPLLGVTLALVIWFKSGTPSRAAEDWADPKLPVLERLDLWLDASRQIAVRQKQGPRWLSEGGRIDRWFDASGHGFDAFQPNHDSMPRFRAGSGVAWARFDGQDDFLMLERPGHEHREITVFLVAAPRENGGGFRGLLSMSKVARNDYVYGLNLDLGPQESSKFLWLNGEAAGASGAFNFLPEPLPFGRFHVFAIGVDTKGTMRVSVDGAAPRERPRTAGSIGAAELFLGARFYSNSDAPPNVSGFFAGDLAEILVYDRSLQSAEHARVLAYLMEKYASLRAESGKAASTLDPLAWVDNPAPVQMFVPGFESSELAVRLPNINCIKYREDGKLIALGYNGRLYLLSDSDGDGAEDKVEVFWDGDSLRAPIGMALTPPGYARGRGVFVAAKGKVSLIVDHDGDDRADEEIMVATGWRELPHGVDALGVALDAEGNVFFGLGTTDFTNAYLVDRATGKSRYDLQSERGTILKVSADFRRREIVCTGIRFPVALAFNRAGNLFCTDQEGATWLPNGNPFDELLHIQPGRHYGFPPRHPKYLPDVIDEPSTFDYAPQHQSLCGLNFNEPVGNGPTFGPAGWRGDALIAGYSRGKLYRTKLVKSEAGYVAQNHLLGVFNSLVVDVCVSPLGELRVATHSGHPDWGSGPQGTGSLWRIQYENHELPQPAFVSAISPTETLLCWDRPLTPEEARIMSHDSAMAAGKYWEAGNRFETIRPGYQVVQDQMGAARSRLPIVSTQWSADRRSLVFVTAPRSEAQNYSLSLHDPAEGLRGRAAQSQTSKAAPNKAVRTIELAYDLTGVEWTWRSEQERDTTTDAFGWSPSLDTEVASALITNTPFHEGWNKYSRSAGNLTLRTQLDLQGMLRPAVQPGSKINYELPPERVDVSFHANQPFRVGTEGTWADATRLGGDNYRVTLSGITNSTDWKRVEVTVPTGGGRPPLRLATTWRTAEDSRERPFPLRRMFLPWATPSTSQRTEPKAEIPSELAGSDWLNGRRLFFSEKTACSQCHWIRGEGRRVGPDLSNLIHRDYVSVLRDITLPNAALNPDHLAWQLELEGDESMTGILQEDTTNAVVIAMAGTDPIRIPKNRIKSLQASGTSLMPEGLGQMLTTNQLRDLLSFLLLSPIEPAQLQTESPPPARATGEVAAFLQASRYSTPDKQQPTLNIVLVDGPKDHGPDEHDYPLWRERWSRLLVLSPRARVTTAREWPSSEQLEDANLLVFYSNNPGWSSERAAVLEKYQARGGGMVFIHYAVDGHKDVEALAKLIGLSWRGGASKFRHGPLELRFPDTSHPVTQGFTGLSLVDESYWNLVGDTSRIRVLASGIEEGTEQPLMWTFENGPGRVFVSIPGHYTWTFDDPAFRLLLLRGMCWAANVPADLLSELATVGARIGEDKKAGARAAR